MNGKPLYISAAILALGGVAAFQWRDELLGRVSSVHTTGSILSGDVGGRLSNGQSPLTNNGQRSPAVSRVAQNETSPPVTVPAAGNTASPVLAQHQTPASPQPVSSAPSQPSVVDESALRYFAAQGDTARLQAEIARLKALYPEWTPPSDPLAGPETGDPQLETMWQLYANGRYAEIRKAIADRQVADPTWQPPSNLTDMLNLAEARQRLVNSSDLKQYNAVIETSAQNPGLLTCGEVDVLWRLAEAFARTDKPERARDAYNYVLSNCDGPSERLATVQKASSLLPIAMMDDLLSKEKLGADGKLEFEPVKDDLARQFVANAGENTDITVPPTYLMRLERLAESDKLASDALLLGWYNVRREKMVDAEKWFRRAKEEDDSAAASQGLALALIARDEPREAEDIMYKWRTSSDDARKTYLAAAANLLALDPPLALEPDVLQRVAAEAVAEKDAATAQEFGWYSRAFQQPQMALQWFTTALSWKADDEASAYGLALSYQDLNNVAEVRRLQQQWGAQSERILNIGRPAASGGQVTADAQRVRSGLQPQAAVAQQAPVAYQQVSETTAPRRPRVVAQTPSAGGSGRCAGVYNPDRLSQQQALQQGWCLMESNRPAEALKAFSAALKGEQATIRSDAAYGQSLAYLRMGLTDNAAVSATKSGMDKTKATELQIAILTDRALAAYQNRQYEKALILLDQRARFATERSDLMVIRGYAYLNLKRYSEAVQVFEGPASTGHRDAVKGLAAARDARPSRGPSGG
ncbi:tetratricopeptide repeat protein [Agrobacterium sp. rho-13.3]|uniref:tetratricopeptide repeat protein n=1 Tax=Agrobacterium sp. rho-13.3 TaxID=3072980 RepID=UPI002A0C5DDA|nr:tetratricopeptide repeat protein [Agrobacterium sp. rho-13.3]MDX8306535.1 cellulose synthase [Agrobacterium sp. rho-13.3]MDX8307134.1 cellulose synthase [Agrobacterium sp. rho-13.3]